MANEQPKERDRRDVPVYAIGIAAAMVTCHPQTLRMYERFGLIAPRRTGGNSRLYSERDIERVRHVQTYTNMGVNLAGIEIIFRLLERIELLEEVVNAAADQLTEDGGADEVRDLLRDRLLEALTGPASQAGKEEA